MNSRYLLMAGLCVSLTITARRLPAEVGPGEFGRAAGGYGEPARRAGSRDYVDFTGRTDAVESVDVRARVTGYLDKVAFKEGDEVKKDDLLFKIDPRPFQAQYDQATGRRSRCGRPTWRIARPSSAGARSCCRKTPCRSPTSTRSWPSYERGRRVGGRRRGQRRGGQAEPRFSHRSPRPIDGRISRANITAGNLVKADETLLTTVVSQDPMYVYFDVDEQTHAPRGAHAVGRARRTGCDTKKVPVLMGLADEEGFPHTGFVDFANNVVDSSTGTITARGVFANPAGPSGSRLLRPGMFVRVRLPLGEPHKAVLVAERALGTDQGKKYLLVVDDQQRGAVPPGRGGTVAGRRPAGDRARGCSPTSG